MDARWPQAGASLWSRWLSERWAQAGRDREKGARGGARLRALVRQMGAVSENGARQEKRRDLVQRGAWWAQDGPRRARVRSHARLAQEVKMARDRQEARYISCEWRRGGRKMAREGAREGIANGREVGARSRWHEKEREMGAR